MEQNRKEGNSEREATTQDGEILPLESDALKLVGGGDEGSGVINIPK